MNGLDMRERASRVIENTTDPKTQKLLESLASSGAGGRTAVATYGVIVRYYAEEGLPPTLEEIGNELGRWKTGIGSRVLPRLEEAGLIESKRSGDRRVPRGWTPVSPENLPDLPAEPIRIDEPVDPSAEDLFDNPIIVGEEIWQ